MFSGHLHDHPIRLMMLMKGEEKKLGRMGKEIPTLYQFAETGYREQKDGGNRNRSDCDLKPTQILTSLMKPYLCSCATIESGYIEVGSTHHASA
jgi:hypothetical protein